MDFVDVLIAILKVVVAFLFLLINTLLLIWAERKVVAWMQNRVGPTRAGPAGILQGLADGIKLFFKEHITPRNVEFKVYILAPIISLIPALLIFTVIPMGPSFMAGEREVTFQVTDLNVGLLFILAMSSTAVYSVVLAGWSSGSKYPLIGGVRATAQAISYEAAMGLALVPPIVYAGTLSLSELVAHQSGRFAGLLPNWHVIVLLPSFILFLIAAIAETNRAPFDLVEAESELVGGFHTEYSGIRFALFFLAEYINIFSMSALAVTVFLGGFNGPTFFDPGTLPAALIGVLWFLVKTYAVVFVFFWIRATLPRLRYDQLMELGWKRLIPATLAWLGVFSITLGFIRFGAPWT
jgi:NADH-quinone oxidoreductase subunit H